MHVKSLSSILNVVISANLTVTSTEDAHRIDDGRWHDVLVQRRGLNFSIQIDRNSPGGFLNLIAHFHVTTIAIFLML